MNTKRQLIGSLLFAAVLVIIGFTFMDRLTTDRAYGQASILNDTRSRSVGDLIAISESVYPLDNPTNVAQWFDNTRTNFMRVSPTNAQLEYLYQGTFYRGFAPTTGTNVVLSNTNTGGGQKTLVFRNGLLINVQ